MKMLYDSLFIPHHDPAAFISSFTDEETEAHGGCKTCPGEWLHWALKPTLTP